MNRNPRAVSALAADHQPAHADDDGAHAVEVRRRQDARRAQALAGEGDEVAMRRQAEAA